MNRTINIISTMASFLQANIPSVFSLFSIIHSTIELYRYLPCMAEYLSVYLEHMAPWETIYLAYAC